jgi:hypothetical protein
MAGLVTASAAASLTSARVSLPGKKKPPKQSTGTTLPRITKLPGAACPLLADDAPPHGHGEIVVLDGDALLRLSATSPSGVTASQLDRAMRNAIRRIK